MLHYVINNPENLDRKQSITKMLTHIGIEPNFFPAIMGHTLSREEIKRLVHNSELYTLGEIGCAQSHLAVMDRLVKSTAPAAIIFEDDIKATPLFTKTLLEEAYHFIASQSTPSALVLKSSEFQDKKITTLSENISIYSVKDIWSMYAYIINKEAAANILKHQKPLHFVIDAWKYYYLLQATNLYCLDRQIVRFTNFESEIDKVSPQNHRQSGHERSQAFNEYVKLLPNDLQEAISKERKIMGKERLKFIITRPSFHIKKRLYKVGLLQDDPARLR